MTTAADPVVPGGRLRYSLIVSNPTEDDLEEVNALFRVPAGISFNGVNDVDPDNGYCGNNTACLENEEATFSLGTVRAGTSRTVSIDALVAGTVVDGTSIAATTHFSATDLSPVSVTKTVVAHTGLSAQLALGTASDHALAGSHLRYDLDIGQLGTNALSNAELHLTLPDDVSIDAVSDGGSETNAGSGEVVWNVGGVAVGMTVHRFVDVSIASGLIGGTLLPARAVLSYAGGPDVDASAEQVVTILAEPTGLNASLVAETKPAVLDGRVRLVATLTNTTTRAVDGVQAMLRVPAGTQYNGVSDTDPDNGYCGNNTACTEHEESLVTLGTLAAGASQRIVYNLEALSATLDDGALYSALLRVNATGIDPVALLETVPVHAPVEAQLRLGSLANPLTAGQTFTLNVDVGQVGANPLANSTVDVYLPAGLAVSSVSDSGSQPATGHVSWSLGTVAVGSTVHRSIEVTADAGLEAGDIVESTAELHFDGGPTIDAAAEYSQAIVGAALPLALELSASPSPAIVDGRLLYTLTITNGSARAVDGVNLLMRVPTGEQFNGVNDADPDNGYCGNNTACTEYEEALWDLGSIAAGASRLVTVNAQVLSTVLAGNLLTTEFRLNATGQNATREAKLTVPTHN